MKNYCKFALFATTALSFGLVVPAIAASGDEEEIIVTARRVEERLQDVPASITVFNQKQLTDRNVVNVQDIALYTPSVTVKSNFSPDVATFNIRGFTQEYKTAPTVGVYVADVVVPRASSQGNSTDGLPPGMMFDLQNVQVLKGPQGTLFGRNTTGGAVLLVPTKPKSEFGGYFEGSYGNYDMRRLQGVLNVPLGTKVRLRVGFDRMTRDGYITNTSGIGPSKLNSTNYVGGRAGLSVDITPDLENYTLAMISNSDHIGSGPKLRGVNPTALLGAGGVEASNPGVLASAQAEVARLQHAKDFYTVESDALDPRVWLQEWWLINTTTWHATDLLTIKNIASYSVLTEKFAQDTYGTNINLPGGSHEFIVYNFEGPHSGLRGQELASGDQHSNDQYNITEELQFQGRSGNNKLTWQTGLYYEQSTPRSASGSTTFNKARCTVLSADAPVCSNNAQIALSTNALRYRDMAAYAQGTYAIRDNLKLDAGFRFTHDETEGWNYEGTFLNGYSGTFFTAAKPFFAVRKTSDAPTWLLGLNYNVTPDMLAYIKYARGYRQGSALPTGAKNGVDGYNPENVEVYEIGSKNTFHGKIRGTVNLAAYYAQFSQQQIQVASFDTNGRSSTLIFNAGQSHMWGLELESSVKPFQNFRIDGSASYLYTKVDSSNFPDLSTLTNVVALLPTIRPSNGPLSYSPKYKASITGTYTLPVPEKVGMIEFSATYAYQSPYESTTPPVASTLATALNGVLGSPFHKMDAENIVNLNLNWNSMFGGPVDASFFVTNLLDDTYYIWNTGTFYLPSRASGAGFDASQVGEPRMFGARLKLRFGADARS